MVRLLDALERARKDPEKESHLALQLDRLFDAVTSAEDMSEDTRLQLDEMEGDYLLPKLVDKLSARYKDNQFQSVLDGLDQLETAIAEAEQEDWLSVAAQYHYRRIQLRAGLQGHDAADEIKEALDFLEDNYSEISSTFITSIVDISIKNVDDLSDTIRDRLIAFLDEITAQHRSANQFNRERDYLRLLRQFRQECGRDTADVERELVESYRTEADMMAAKSKLQKADILQTGVAECREYMSEDRKRDWKQEVFQDRRAGMEDELIAMPLDDIVADTEMDGESREAAKLRKMEEDIETLVEWFKAVKQGPIPAHTRCIVWSCRAA